MSLIMQIYPSLFLRHSSVFSLGKLSYSILWCMMNNDEKVFNSLYNWTLSVQDIQDIQDMQDIQHIQHIQDMQHSGRKETQDRII